MSTKNSSKKIVVPNPQLAQKGVSIPSSAITAGGLFGTAGGAVSRTANSGYGGTSGKGNPQGLTGNPVHGGNGRIIKRKS